ncbi:MAG: AraC family transcriptional regulator [Clostridia bacterium]|nr:AraC family transcriptional regulator [Clostridia bacterium]
MSYYSIRGQRAVLNCNPVTHGRGICFPAGSAPYHDVIYCVTGEWEIWQNGVPYSLQDNDLLFLHANIEHYGKKPCKKGTKVIYIHLSADAEDVFSEYLCGRKNGFAEIPPLVHCSGNGEIGEICREITESFWHESDESHERSGLLAGLLLLIASIQSEKDVDKSETLVDRCQSLLLKNYNRFLDAGEIASVLGVSQKRIREMFKNDFGMTPLQYQREMKINRAVALMTEYPDIRFKDISDNLGYGSEKSFNACFKAKLSLSPSSYREKIINGEIMPDYIFRKPRETENVFYIVADSEDGKIRFTVPAKQNETVWFHLKNRTFYSCRYSIKIITDGLIYAELCDGRLTKTGKISLNGEQISDCSQITAEAHYEFTA